MSDGMPTDERPNKRPRLSPDIADANGSASAPAEAHEKNEFTLVLDPKETQVGITQFVSQDVVPFQAVLKTRYTDFLVNEILPNGEVVHLTTTSLPKQLQPFDGSSKKVTDAAQKAAGVAEQSLDVAEKVADGARTESTVNSEEPANAEAEAQDSQPQPAPAEVSDDDRQQLISYLNENAVGELLDLYNAILKYPSRKSRDHTIVRTQFTSDRSLRAEIHAAIRRIFSSKIESSTDNDGFLCLTAANPKARNRYNQQNSNNPSPHPGKLGWLERGGEFLHFTLYKENKDTMEAISYLCRQLKISAKVFQFAGTKDRRAVTSQRISAHRTDAARLMRLNKHLRNASVGDFEYRPAGLELGDLGGNEFVITLRELQFASLPTAGADNLPPIQASLDTALSDLHFKGFLNYYGLQRFGTFSTRTDTVGLHILKSDFRAACEAILDYDASILTALDSEDLSNDSAFNPTDPTGAGRDELQRARAIQLFQKTANAHKSVEILPKKFSAENQLMRHLSRTPSDYVGALLTIPRGLRLMYVHAYQSLIWNKAVTNRWELYGSQVVEGDLVLVREHRDKDPSVKQSTTEEETSNVDADGEIIIAPSSHDRSSTLDDIFERARALTAEEAASGQYTIFDLVLPMPGFDVLYPANASGDYYKTFMGSDEGGYLDPYDMRRKQKDFSLSGGYRKVMARIGENFSVQVYQYERDEEQFVETDLQKIQKSKAPPREHSDDQRDLTRNAALVIDKENLTAQVEVKTKVAAVLKFQLGSSQYATMALRELSRGGVTAYKPDFSGGKQGVHPDQCWLKRKY